MYSTLKTLQSEIASLLKSYKFLKKCKADDTFSKETLEEDKQNILSLINKKQNLGFSILDLLESETDAKF